MWNDAAEVAVVVDALLFLGQVPGPVLVEVAVADQGAEFEDGLGAVQAPACAGDVHAVLDQVAAGALDHPGGDRPPLGQGGGVVQVGLLGQQVRRGGIGGFTFAGVQTVVGGLAADRGGHDAGPPGQDLPGLGTHPLFGVRVAFGVEAPGGLPDVLDDVDEVHHDRDGGLPGFRFGANPVDLMLIAVDQGDPGPRVVGVAAVGPRRTRP